MVDKTIAHYEVLDELGAGGMGVVYRARDTRLDREAAIKALPEELDNDAERLARFEREAKLLASLKNPHIATVYGLEEVEGRRFLAMELVEGRTLAERLSKGPIPVRKALELARQIAEALEAAHGADVIHRDVKPGNIMIDKDGKAKVLDFGLSKALGTNASEADPSLSPTLSQPMTQAGQILGTPVYMSPEQVEGKGAGKQSDIWAFGCVLYEMVAGKRAFPGGVGSDPGAEPDWQALPRRTPLSTRRTIRHCLHRDLRYRLHDIADVRIEIEEAILQLDTGETVEDTGRSNRARHWKGIVALALFLAAATATLGWIFGQASSVPAPPIEVIHFTVPVPGGFEVGVVNNPMLALSPDGRKLVYASEGVLHLRSLDRLESRRLARTEGAEPPFFSPDGRWIGFAQSGRLRKVSVDGGPVTDISSAPVGEATGATWSEGGSIVFALGGSTFGIWRIDAAGGALERLTTVDDDALEAYHKWPQLLDGDRLLLYSVIGSSARWEDAKLVVEELETGKRTTVALKGTYGRYLPTGHIVYTDASGTLLAVPFDLESVSVTGAAFPVASGVLTSWFAGSANFAVSDAGTAVFAHGSSWSGTILWWVDRNGDSQRLAGPMTGFSPRLAPDGRRLAIAISQASNSDIYIIDAVTGERERFTFAPPHDETPVWSPDGSRIAYGAQWTAREFRIYLKELDAAGGPALIYSAKTHTHIFSWSPDGRWLAFSAYVPDQQEDVFVLDLDNPRKRVQVVATPALERDARFSPDGHWLAYTSDETGTDEVYVTSFPESGARKYQVSTGGGVEPRWSRKSNELFFEENGTLMVTAVTSTEESFEWEAPQPLFELNGSLEDVTVDGQRFLVKRKNPDGPVREIHVVLNWFEELKRRAPAE